MPKWSPNGKCVAFISDKSGEDEICIMNQDGSEASSRSPKMPIPINISPLVAGFKEDSLDRRKLRLSYVDIATKDIVEVAQADRWEMRSIPGRPIAAG